MSIRKFILFILLMPLVFIGYRTHIDPNDPTMPSGSPFKKQEIYISCLFQDENYLDHNGLDIPCEKGDYIFTTMAGQVVDVHNSSTGYGNLVVIENNGVQVYFGHLNTMFVAPGDNIEHGELIGICGNTGSSSGYHLHYGIKRRNYLFDTWLDPLDFMKDVNYIKIKCKAHRGTAP